MITLDRAIAVPRAGMLATLRNRRGIVASVEPYDTTSEGRLHLVRVEYTDADGAPRTSCCGNASTTPRCSNRLLCPALAANRPCHQETSTRLFACAGGVPAHRLSERARTPGAMPITSPVFGVAHR